MILLKDTITSHSKNLYQSMASLETLRFFFKETECQNRTVGWDGNECPHLW